MRHSQLGSFTYGLSGWAATCTGWKASWMRRGAAWRVQPEDLTRANDAAGLPFRLLRTGPATGPPRAGGQPGLVSRAARGSADAIGVPAGGCGGVAASLAVNEAPSRLQRSKSKSARSGSGTSSPLSPRSRSCSLPSAGLRLQSGRRLALWLDAVQLERGDHATAYEPRQPVETFIETGQPGTSSPTGGCFALALRAFNDTDRQQEVRGHLQVIDFFDRTVLTKTTLLRVPDAPAGTRCCRSCPWKERFFRAI